MTYDRMLAAVSFGDTKTAALYFDRVLPVEFRVMRGTGSGIICEMPDPIDVEVVVKLVFGDEAPRHLIISYLDDYWAPFMARVRPAIIQPRKSTDPEAYVELKNLYLSNAGVPGGSSVRQAFHEFAASLGVRSFSVLLPHQEGVPASFSDTYAFLAASRLSLVDTSRASWDQVMELRNDPEARAQLRRLRLFFLESYIGKSREYVEDDLLCRMDDYERARKKHGFDAVTSTLSVLLDARTLQAAAVAGVSTALFGGPISGISVGAAVELGKVVLEVTKQRAAIKDLADGHELGYVLRARDKLDD
jgi:hypothetical protein